MTKFLSIVILCVLGAALIKAEFNKEEAIKQFMEIAEGCRVEVGATEEELSNLVKKIPLTSKEGKCMKACIMKKVNVMDSDGKFVQSAAMEHAKKWSNGDAAKMKIAQEITDTCGAISLPGDHCDAAATLAECFIKEAKARGIDKLEM